jgi:hypothetical protein
MRMTNTVTHRAATKRSCIARRKIMDPFLSIFSLAKHRPRLAVRAQLLALGFQFVSGHCITTRRIEHGS